MLFPLNYLLEKLLSFGLTQGHAEPHVLNIKLNVSNSTRLIELKHDFKFFFLIGADAESYSLHKIVPLHASKTFG